jgi:beta-galactosidase
MLFMNRYMQNVMNREIIPLMKEWYFHRGDIATGQDPKLDDDEWRELDLPHDWTIEGRFIEHRNENWSRLENFDHRIGYLPQGIGWYRKHFTISDTNKEKQVKIQFDGVYRNAEVWINGEYLGCRPYGYSSFYYDLTPHIKFGKNNIIAVKVDNTGVSSRWYSGSGIYRKVFITLCDNIHVDQWGTYWTTPEITAEHAKVNLQTSLVRENENSAELIDLISEIYSGKDKVTEVITKQVEIKKTLTVSQEIIIKTPKLWSPDNPNMYLIKTKILNGSKVVDEYSTPLGIRTFRFEPERGFFLNKENIKMKGVCLHHDNGCLGAKIYHRAVERKLEILKEMGCNAIRTSHNPPSQELLELCDEMGFLVMDEVFDEWTRYKTPEGYWNYFKEWYEQDVRDFIRRDRNHPSIIIWSCGNEVPEQRFEDGLDVLRKLMKIFKEEDPTRPVTQGCNSMEEANKHGFAQLLDIPGYNYYGDRISGPAWADYPFRCKYDDEHETYPDRILLGSENVSALNTRGVYHDRDTMDIQRWQRPDFHCSAYDIKTEVPLMVCMSRPYVCGMFTWEGFDYIGEPSPYPWPARSSQYGIFDLCGFPKDTYYLYKSQWVEKPLIHILPHWNWEEGEKIEVWVYSNCESAELFLNGESLGEYSFKEDFDDVLHLVWDVPFKAGELKAIGKTNGKEIISSTIQTTGFPNKICLQADRQKVSEGDELIHLTASVCDAKGNVIPNSHNLILFKVEGPGEVIGVGNGNPISHEPFVDQQRHVFNGLCLAVIKIKEGKGPIKIQATSAGLKLDAITIEKIE